MSQVRGPTVESETRRARGSIHLNSKYTSIRVRSGFRNTIGQFLATTARSLPGHLTGLLLTLQLELVDLTVARFSFFVPNLTNLNQPSINNAQHSVQLNATEMQQVPLNPDKVPLITQRISISQSIVPVKPMLPILTIWRFPARTTNSVAMLTHLSRLHKAFHEHQIPVLTTALQVYKW